MILKGQEAIDYAEANSRSLNKYNDPTEDAREDVTPYEARLIASEDPNLIWLDAPDCEMRVSISDNQTTESYHATSLRAAAISYASNYDCGEHDGWVAAIATDEADPDYQLCFRFSAKSDDVIFGDDAEWLSAWQEQ